ncbi:MAG: hypothetical protein JOZ69_07500 [Myxococcales bacterium]|nr:hypothetical protein [Myxococcales bacterium]
MTEDAPLPPLDAEVRALVDRTRDIPPAPSPSKGRVLARVQALVGPPGGGGSGGGVPASSSGSPSAALLRRALPLAASFALGAGFGAFAMHEHEGRRSDPVAILPQPTIARPGAVLPSPAPSPALSTVATVMGETALPLPTEKARATPAPSAAPVDQLTAERSLLDLARGALEREDPQAALRETMRHERRYPHGILVQEREAMAIRALVALDRVEEARGRVDLFRRRFPDSVLLPTLEGAVRE